MRLIDRKVLSIWLNNFSLCYIYSYLKDCKQCVQMNNEQSEFDTIISGVHQGLIFRPILFNIFFNNFFSNSLASFTRRITSDFGIRM